MTRGRSPLNTFILGPGRDVHVGKQYWFDTVIMDKAACVSLRNRRNVLIQIYCFPLSQPGLSGCNTQLGFQVGFCWRWPEHSASNIYFSSVTTGQPCWEVLLFSHSCLPPSLPQEPAYAWPSRVQNGVDGEEADKSLHHVFFLLLLIIGNIHRA